jgi:uncharacterized protein (TIGR00730 family)
MSETEQSLRSICVYCGSQDGADPSHAEAARAMGDVLADRGIRLVFGGGHIGMMGQIADRVLERGGEVVGVIPKALMRKEVAHEGLTELHVTECMHERKAMMADLSDGFITMPGGLGTMEELFEIWTWAQIGIHSKPFGLLNVRGYYDGLLSFLDHAAADGYVRPEHRSMLHIDEQPVSLLDKIAGQHAC